LVVLKHSNFIELVSSSFSEDAAHVRVFVHLYTVIMTLSFFFRNFQIFEIKIHHLSALSRTFIISRYRTAWSKVVKWRVFHVLGYFVRRGKKRLKKSE